jgi:hypothetical protein
MPGKMHNSTSVDNTQQDNGGCVQLKETPKLSTCAKEKMPLLPESANEIISSMKIFESRC